MCNNVIKTLRPYIEEIVTNQNLHLFDLEFVKEDGTWFLRVSIEKEDGTMDFDTAENVCNIISAKLDELDPIDHAYVLDVCSPGVERPIRNKEEFENNLHQYISVYLKDSKTLEKPTYTGDLVEVCEDYIVLSIKEKTKMKNVEILFKDIVKAHIAIKF